MTIQSAKLSLAFEASQKSGSNAFGQQYWSGEMSLVQAFTDGTTAGKFDLLYVAERTVASATNDDIDLAGVLSDIFGSTITAAELVGLIVINKHKDGTANTTNLTIGGGTNPVVGFLGGTTPTVGPIPPGGIFTLMSPAATGIGAVAAGSADVLRIANSSGASNTYQIAALARSA
jgi:hypothetical protein